MQRVWNIQGTVLPGLLLFNEDTLMFPSVKYLLRVRNEISTCQSSLILAATVRAPIPCVFFLAASRRIVAAFNAALS